MSKAKVIPNQDGYILLGSALCDLDAAIEVGSPGWFEWLQDNRSFSFAGDAGQFNALKERVRDKGWYWKAYRWQNGRRRSAYLGRSEDLSVERLEEAAKNILQTNAAAEARSVQRVARTKMFVPALRPGHVVRQRLLQRMRSGAQLPITVVMAPAGYGKTTLVADWVRADKRDVAWLSLDAGDNNSNQFWASLGSALDAFDLGTSQNIQAELNTLQQRPIPIAIIAGVINEFIARLKPDSHGRPRLLVIDDFHLVTDPELLQALIYFADRLPPSLHLVITTRQETNLPMSRWRVQHRVSELRAVDLAFNDFEARAFLAGTMGVKLGDEAVGVLEARTEGWVAALQLAALSLQSHADPAVFIGQFRGNHQHVMSYLVDQVMAQLPAHVLEFITRASVLDRMCDDLCRALLDDSTSAAFPTLHELEQANLFVIALDQERRWYRFHHLFADLLQARLEKTEHGLAQKLHARASRWFEDAGDIQSAIQHAMHAGDIVRAAHLVAADVESCWRRHSMLTPSESWVERLPDEYIRQHATLMIARASIHLRQLQTSAAEMWLNELEHILAGASVCEDTQIIRGRLAMLRSYTIHMQLGDARRALKMSEEALAIMPKRDHVWRAHALMTHATLLNVRFLSPQLAYDCIGEAGELALSNNNLELYIHCLFLSAQFLCYGGLLRRAEAALTKATRMVKAWNMPSATSRYWCENAMMRLYYERNDLQTVEGIARPLLEQAIAGTDHIAIVNASVHLVHVCMARGALDEAMRFIDMAEPVCASSPYSKLYIASLHANLLAAKGDLTLLETWIAEVAPKMDDRLVMRIPGIHVDLRMLMARAYITLGDADRAILMINAYITHLEEAQAQDLLIRCLIIRALAHEKSGARAEALDDLSVALSLGKPEGYLRVFLDEGPAMFNLLLATRAKNIEPAYVMKLLEAFNPKQAVSSDLVITTAPAVNDVEAMQWVESISSREKQVLVLLAAGHTNQSIADTLGISVTTVKSHAGAIYTKLGVKSRTQAIARARELGLLS